MVALAFLGLGVQVWRSVGRAEKSIAELGAGLLPDVAQRMQFFKRVKVKDGRTVWEITADDAQYFDKQNAVVVRRPRVTFSIDDGERRGELTGTEGRLVLVDRELESMVLRGSVVLKLDDMVLNADEATYDRTRDLITVPGDVTITGSDLDLTAHGMEVDVTPQLVRFQGDVRTVLKDDAKRS
ncbi:MAG: LPS export ABC transporter periplasmic protein LptC [bacterium]|nr:LPS export ABC transporter periplasmic protein LptC [bacterium]